MNKLIVTMLMFFSLSLGVVSCNVLSTLSDPEMVLTTENQVIDGAEFEVVPTDQIPPSLADAVPEGTVVVLTDRDSLKKDSTFVALGPNNEEGGMLGLLNVALGVGGVFFPGLAAWEGVLTLFSKRKRQHYAKAAKQATPLGPGPMDVRGALTSLAAAIGGRHSSKETEEVFEAEELAATS